MPQRTLDELMRANGAITVPGEMHVSMASGQTIPPPGDVDPLTALMQANGALGAEEDFPAPEGNDLGTFLSHAWQQANPVTIATGLGQLVPLPQAAGGSGLNHPFNPVRDASTLAAIRAEGRERWAAGDHSGAVAKMIYGSLPYVGPMLSHMGDQFEAGEVAAPLGDIAGMALGNKMVGAVTSRALRAPRVVRARPSRVVTHAQREGIPLTVGQATGLRWAQGAQQLADWTPLGSLIDYLARRRQTAALTASGERLAQGVRPGAAVTIDNAGEALQAQLESRRAAERGLATNRYGIVETAATDPANAVVRRPRAGAAPTPMQLPVNLQFVRASLRPVLEHVQRFMPEAQRQMSAGVRALENLVHGDNNIPLLDAETNLGALKEIVRKTKGRERALAQQGVARLQQAIDRTAARADPAVARALTQARESSAARFRTEALLKKVFGKDALTDPVNAEVGNIVRKVTAADDRNIRLLRRVRGQAPTAMPGVARAVLDDLLAQNGQRMQADWRNLGPQTKQILFTPAQVEALDLLTEIHARIARTANPSGTAVTAMTGLTGLGGWLTNPGYALGATVGGGVTSAMLRSPAAVRLLTRGLRLALQPAGPATTAATQAAQVGALIQAAERAAGETRISMPTELRKVAGNAPPADDTQGAP